MTPLTFPTEDSNKRTRPWLRAFLQPFEQFAATGSLGSVLLLCAMLVAFLWANSPWRESYFAMWRIELVIGPSSMPLTMSLGHWINDGLMAVFFLLVGLEIKRELLVGELATVRQASLPVIAALGGMIVPGLIYSVFNAGTPAIRGWGIPMATDIAFALGVLQLMGPRCPVGLKVFLTALAIIDDLGAIIVIALFYTDSLSLPAMLLAAVTTVILVTMNRMRVRQLTPYLVVGALLWYAVLSSGIHATIAGVLLALTIPVRTRMKAADFSGVARELLDDFERLHSVDLDVITNRAQQEAIHGLESASMAVQAPLLRLEHALASAVAYGILPLFALANAGVSLSGAQAPWAGTVGLGVVLGLLFGKPIGITLFSWIAVKRGWAALPLQVNWRALHGAAWLGGIGFTMALFIAGLAFEGTPLLDEAKLSILLASVLAGFFGRYLVLRALARSGESGEASSLQPGPEQFVSKEPLST